MNKKLVYVAIQLAAGILPLVAIITQFVLQIQHHASIVNFFSYFTNLSNIFSAIVMLVGAYLLIKGRTSKTYDIIRGASVVYMAVVGIVFSLLLSGAELGILLAWVNNVLHYIMPIVVVAYWFISPPKNKLSLKQGGYWLIFPAMYLAYSLVRGAITQWYPYPFLNPANGGYGTVALYSLLVLVIFVVFGVAVRAGIRKK